MALFLYRLLSVPVSGIFYILQRRWIAAGKEDPTRAPERWGRTDAQRDTARRLVWFHAASVGESVALLDVIRRILAENPGWQVLVTTVTRSSADIMAKSLPVGAIHQLLPFEYRPAVRRFLKHWKPDLVVWTESDLWPINISEIHAQKIPSVLINGVMSEKSYLRLKRAQKSIVNLLAPFEAALTKDNETLERYRDLGLANGNITCVGSLKEAAGMEGYDAAHLEEFQHAIKGRPVWLAASTHPGEFDQIATAHATLLTDHPALLLIHAPRHPQDAALIEQSCGARGWKVAHRSKAELPGKDCAVFIADTIGEMGLWHRAAPISFIGGSLSADMGHNPFEAAALGSAILYGWSVEHFGEAYGRYAAAGGAMQVQNAAELAKSVAKLMDPAIQKPMTIAAKQARHEGAAALSKTYDFLQQRLT